MNLSPADRAAWATYEAGNRRAADHYAASHWQTCAGCGNRFRTYRQTYCDRACYLAAVRKDPA